jgi:hypothetical protein
MSKWREVVHAVAPTVGKALGGPLGGAAASTIARVVLGQDTASDKELDRALANADPEILHKLKEAENEFEARMAELGVDLERIAADDRASARRREADVGGWIVPVLGTAIMAGFFLVVVLTLLGFAEVESALAGTLVGFVAAKAEQVVSYFYGSSAGSASKNKLMSSVRDRS